MSQEIEMAVQDGLPSVSWTSILRALASPRSFLQACAPRGPGTGTGTRPCAARLGAQLAIDPPNWTRAPSLPCFVWQFLHMRPANFPLKFKHLDQARTAEALEVLISSCVSMCFLIFRGKVVVKEQLLVQAVPLRER